MSADLRITSKVSIPGSDLEWSAVRASGPGGQNVNKVASKVELRFDLANTNALDGAVRARLRLLAKNRLDADGRIVIVSQVTRNQPQNLEDAREKLAELVRQAFVVPKPRRATKPTKASKRRRVDAKRQRSKTKATRAKVRGSDE